MYKVYVNGELIFNDQLPDEDLVLVKPKLVLEDNQPGTFDFTLPFEHRHINKTNSFGRPFCGSKTDTVTIYKNGQWLWEGRPVSETSNFYNQRVIHCEGALSYFSDSIQPLKVQISTSSLSTAVWSFLAQLLDRHNEQLETIGEKIGIDLSDRMIYLEKGVSIVTVMPKNVSSFTRITNYETTLESINKRLINKLEGHIRIRRVTVDGVSKLVLDYLEDYPDTSGQKIEFGKNLLDYNKSIDMTEIATVIIPRGDTVEKNSPFYRNSAAFSDISQKAHLGWSHVLPNGEPVGDQRIYASNAIIKEYGYIEKVVEFENIEAKYASSANGYSRSTGWSSIEAYRNATTVIEETNSNYKTDYLWALKILSEDYLANIQFEKLELELSVFDLSYLGVQNTQDFKLLDNVICSSKSHGMIDKSFPLQKMEIMLDDPEDTKITLGESKKKSISTTSGVLASNVEDDPGDYSEYYKNLLMKAKYQADALIEGAASGLSNGYMTIIQKTANDESRYSDGIIISNERILPSEMTGDSGYLTALRNTHPTMKLWVWNSGGLGYYDFSQGVNKLVSAITSDGKIVADAITTGTLTSISISGCNLTLGTVNSKNAKLTVNTSSGTFTVDKDGLICKDSDNYYLKIVDGSLYGGKGNDQYCYINATASVVDLGVSSHPTYHGLVLNGNVIAIDTSHVVVKNPHQSSSSSTGNQYYTNAATVKLKNVEFSINGGDSYKYGDLIFVEGLLVGYPSGVAESV